MGNIFEMEAELGSDNEENDHIVKQINQNADEEIENPDLDKDLEDLIDHEINENVGCYLLQDLDDENNW